MIKDKHRKIWFKMMEDNHWLITKFSFNSYYKSYRRDGHGIMQSIYLTDALFADAYKTYKPLGVTNG